MVEVVGIFGTVLGYLSSIMGTVRGVIVSVAGDWANIVMLGIAVVGGYYISKRYPAISGTTAIILYGLLLFLLLKFV